MSTAKPGEAGEAVRVAVLSRRDRAAMALALELCRAGESVGRVRSALAHGGPVAAGIAEDTYGIAVWEPLPIVRARLALALRVLLRVDRDDFGPHARVPTGKTCHRVDHHVDGITHRCRADACGCYRSSRRYRALWEHAAAAGDRRDDSAARAAGGWGCLTRRAARP